MASSQTTRWKVLDDRVYDDRHQWIQPSASLVTVGITDYTQDTAGEILYVSLPEPGTALVAGQPFGSIESGKWVGQLYAPANGTVIAANDGVLDHPEQLNQDPYGQGWLVKFVPESPDFLQDLADADTYRSQLTQLDGEFRG